MTDLLSLPKSLDKFANSISNAIESGINNGFNLIESTEDNIVLMYKETASDITKIFVNGELIIQDTLQNIAITVNNIINNVIDIVETAEIGGITTIKAFESDTLNLIDDISRNVLRATQNNFELAITSVDDAIDNALGVIYTAQNNLFSTVQLGMLLSTGIFSILIIRYGDKIFATIQLAIMEATGVLKNIDTTSIAKMAPLLLL
jgi:phage-related protein